MAMFQQPARPNGTVHVEFRAGRMDWDGKMVKPDKRKGKIVLSTSEEEQLMHFQWYDREKNEVATDLIVINDAYLERIEKCTTGRVYLLRFTSSDKKLFFWMQEPKTEKDAEFVKTFNETIGAKIPEKGAPKPAAAAGAPAAPAGPTGPEYDNKGYKKDWHKEWKQGDVPSWKETYPKEALPYEDSQSDGKISPALSQVDSVPKPVESEPCATDTQIKGQPVKR